MPAIQRWWGIQGGIVIPAGIIMPFNDVAANIPSGWQHWTGGANRAFVGHNTTAGTQGGVDTIARQTNSEGIHTGSSYVGWMGDTPGAIADLTSASSGGHYHTLTVNYSPARRFQVMMKALVKTNKFPAKTGILSDFTIPGLTNITLNGYLLCGASGTASSNNAATSSISNVNNTGQHDHLGGISADNPDNNAAATVYAQGSHTHGGSAGITDSAYRYYMGMWAHASQEMKAIPGIYGIWESATPPKGWDICNGANGTPNLSGYHIGLDTTKLGTKTGNGTITTSASLSTAGGHTHNGAVALRAQASTCYHPDSVTHAHSVGAAAAAYAPLNRTVIFIRARG